MKIALVSTGLGHVRRGFESFTEALFHALKRQAPDMEVMLFQGGGIEEPDRKNVPNLPRYKIPARWFAEDPAGRLEQRSFALFLYPLLRRGGFTLVHYN
ncbi:MAG: hypothetical protein NTY64_08125, partial [Deltaproteobacteria bacterium]|nr:hypothetical protein [Deltaproteobacteria bacterium]